MPIDAPSESAEKTLRLVGWQIAAGILFIVFGLEIAISDAVIHSMQPFEHLPKGFDAITAGGLGSSALFVVGSLNIGVASWRFAKVLQKIASRFSE